MKNYQKPEVEEIKFVTMENIASGVGTEGGAGDIGSEPAQDE